MFCSKCGAENENGTKFCRKCGQPLEGNSGSNSNSPNTAPISNGNPAVTAAKASGSLNAGAQPTQLTGKVKSIPKQFLIGGIAAAVVFIIIIIIALGSGKTIDLDQYMTVEATGYDGYGTASANIDWTGIEEKYGSKLSFGSAAKREYGGLLNYMSPIEVLQGCVGVSIDGENGNLSNGDTVSYTWDVSEDISEYVNCKVKFSNGSQEISGLTEVGSFDPFADLQVEFSGTAPKGTVKMNYTGSELSPYDFHCDKTSGLSNGDSIEINLGSINMERFAQNYGKIPSATSKTYTVEGLPEYVMKYSDLTDAFIKDLKTEAEDAIYSYTASSYDKTWSMNNLEYAGYVFNSLKDMDSYNSLYNFLYIIYKGDVASSEDSFSPAKVYYPVLFTNILKEGDGVLSYDNDTAIEGQSQFDRGWNSTEGFLSPFECFIGLAENNSKSYNFECGDGFELYAEYQNVEKLSDISEAYIETLSSDAKDKIESYIASDYNDTSHAEGLTLVGEYLLTAKNPARDFKDNSKLFLVFSATVTDSNDRFAPTTVYYPVEYDGLVKLPKDEYMFTKSQGIQGSSNFNDSYYSTKGYADGAEMFSSLITANRDNYKYEVSDGLKAFGE